MTKAQLQAKIEELNAKVAILETDVKARKEKEEAMRTEFAKAFDWTKAKDDYDKTRVYTTPSWCQIFTRIGELLNSQDQINLAGKTDDNKEEIILLRNIVRDLYEDNKTSPAELVDGPRRR